MVLEKYPGQRPAERTNAALPAMCVSRQREREASLARLVEDLRLVGEDDRIAARGTSRERSVEIGRQRAMLGHLQRGGITDAGKPQRTERHTLVDQEPDPAVLESGDDTLRVPIHLVIAEGGEDGSGITKCSRSGEELRNEVRIVVDEVAENEHGVGLESARGGEDGVETRHSREESDVQIRHQHQPHPLGLGWKSFQLDGDALDADRHECVVDPDDRAGRCEAEKDSRRPARECGERRAPAHGEPREREENREGGVENRERVPGEPERTDRRARDPRERVELTQHRKERPHQIAEDGSADDPAPPVRVNAHQRAHRDQRERTEDEKSEGEEEEGAHSGRVARTILIAVAHFDIPMDLPHAGRLADRILSLLERYMEEKGIESPELLDAAERLSNLLFRYTGDDENPDAAEALRVRDEAAVIARELVSAAETASIQLDRLGQYVRNLFECLELGEEGAEISLRAGENPDSLQRPV